MCIFCGFNGLGRFSRNAFQYYENYIRIPLNACMYIYIFVIFPCDVWSSLVIILQYLLCMHVEVVRQGDRFVELFSSLCVLLNVENCPLKTLFNCNCTLRLRIKVFVRPLPLRLFQISNTYYQSAAATTQQLFNLNDHYPYTVQVSLPYHLADDVSQGTCFLRKCIYKHLSRHLVLFSLSPKICGYLFYFLN